MKKKVWAHVLVRNEENFIWFAINSCLDYVDRILIYDLGSTDKTVEIIKTIQSGKIILKEKKKNKDMIELSQMRQEMLDETKADWILILDGDEIWPENSIKEVKKAMNEDKYECIFVPTYMLLGDIYHYQESDAGDYEIAGKKGHYNVRGISTKIAGLHLEVHKNNQGLYREGYFDRNGRLVYERDNNKLIFLNAPYLHASHLRRSSKDGEVFERKMRFKYELGIHFPRDFQYPRVFYKKFPSTIKDPKIKMSLAYKIPALIQTPLKKLKRKIKK